MQLSCDESQAPGLRAKGWQVLSDADYENRLSEMTGEFDEYLANKTQLSVEASIASAMAFGSQLLREFSAQNVLLGITQAGMTGSVLSILTGVMQALLAGSLYEAIERVKAVDPADYDGTYLSAVRCLTFVNKIEGYLGLPLSTEL